MNNCTPLWRKADLEVKKFKNTAPPEHFWELRCSKSVRCCGAKHMWKSKCKGTPDSEHFWKLRCSRRCGAKRVSKSKCRKRCSSGARLEVEKVHAVVARSTFPRQGGKSAACSRRFWRLRCGVHTAAARSTFRKETCEKHTTFGLLDVQPHHTTLHYN